MYGPLGRFPRKIAESMLFTSIVAELLRARPRLIFWVATLAQAALWWIVPSVLYSAPPGDLPLVLAVGHQFRAGSAFGPPLAFWSAELVFDVAGMAGVYLLAQACVVIAYCGIFALARALVGIHHAVFAILLMAGISTFAAPTPDFGPAILAMPLWAFAILNLWRAIGAQRRSAWVRLGFQLGLLLLTSYAGFALVVALAVFLVATRHGRQALGTLGPWIATVLMLAVASPYLLWLRLAAGPLSALFAPDRPAGAAAYLARLTGVGEALVLAHAGLLVLVAISWQWWGGGAETVPVFRREPMHDFARRFVLFFFLAPLCITVFVAIRSGPQQAPGTFTPLLLLSGLVVVMLVGDAIAWHRAPLTAMVWSLLLVVPPLTAAASIVALPWLGISGVEVARPAAAMGRFVAANFQRRIGLPLTIVSGDPRTAALVALGAPTRPSLYLDAAPRFTPWVTAADIQRKGAVVVWPNAGTSAEVPPAIAARFPALVADVPRDFARRVQGRLPPLWLGWGVLRPQQPLAATPPGEPAQP